MHSTMKPLATTLFPPSRWPRRYQYALIAGALIFVLTLSILAFNYRQQSLRNEQTQLANAQAELATYRQRLSITSQSSLDPSTSAQLPAPPKANAINQIVGDMTRFAQHHRVQLLNLTIEATASSAQHLAQRQITTQAKADYAGFKAWMGEMLARYPWLAIKSLSGQSTDTGLDVNMTWVLYVQD
jgi:hypothetical protein